MRILSGFKNGKGDLGKSLLLNKTYVWKDHPTCVLYGAVEELQQALSECIVSNKDLNSEVKEVMIYLRDNMFSLSSFCFLKAEDGGKHQLDEKFLPYLNKSIKHMASEVGHAKDFLILDNEELLRINKIRVAVRKVESAFISWYRSKDIQRHMYGIDLPLLFLIKFLIKPKPHLVESISSYAKLLNRMSTYFFWVCRQEGKSLGKDESYWRGEAQEFFRIRTGDCSGECV